MTRRKKNLFLEKLRITNFSENQKLSKSLHGALRTVLSKSITLRGGVPQNVPDILVANFKSRLTCTCDWNRFYGQRNKKKRERKRLCFFVLFSLRELLGCPTSKNFCTPLLYDKSDPKEIWRFWPLWQRKKNCQTYFYGGFVCFRLQMRFSKFLQLDSE